jgi:hypothetical protein
MSSRDVHLLIKMPPTAAGSVPVGREKADATNVGSVGAPMAGAILEVIAKPGASRRQPWTSVSSPRLHASANGMQALSVENHFHPFWSFYHCNICQLLGSLLSRLLCQGGDAAVRHVGHEDGDCGVGAAVRHDQACRRQRGKIMRLSC